MAGLIQLGIQEERFSRREVAQAALAQPLALYVHIPFCVRKCHYCDFAAGPAPEAIREQYVEALAEEIRRSPWAGRPARTVFFGGGTPSELSTPQLQRVVSALQDSFPFVLSDPAPTPNVPFPAPATEWSIECNPGTVSPQSLVEMREMGFNRVSLGVQSFHDPLLQSLGRIHRAAEALDAVEWVRAAGFRRLNLDLIFCLPGQTLEQWRSDLEQVLSLGVDHISLYNLTIEEETEFGRRHRAGILSLPDEDLSADMYEWAIDRTAAAGLEQYEVSNFARPGEECRHNQVYWRREPSLGFGLGAASFVDGARWGVTRGMQRYLATARDADGPELAWQERLDPETGCGEAIMLELRTREGSNLTTTAERFGLDAELRYGETLRQLLQDGLLERAGERIRLTRRGVLLANRVCAAFLPD